PLAGALLNIVFGRVVGRRAHWIAVPALAGSFLASCAVFARVSGGEAFSATLFRWIVAGDFETAVTAWVGPRTGGMPLAVPGVGCGRRVLATRAGPGPPHYAAVFKAADTLSPAAATGIALLLFMGACGKSAQLPLHVWLPDAMEGPTPVSALIHAATMVTAGVYVVARSHVLFSHSSTAMLVDAMVGCATAFFAATIGLVQTDIKKVLAYSTVSQLGYMFLACGVGAFTAGIFHLMTHAFFKALLFLAAG